MSINNFRLPEADATALNAAQIYHQNGWYAAPVPPGKKGPVIPNWQALRLSADDLPKYFSNGNNIGLLTGEASNNLGDLDMDCPEAVAVAALLLPQTLISGRPGNPRSHYWFVTESAPAYWKASDLEGKTILELRGSGHQTLVPPSRHPEGDVYRWENKIRPLSVSALELENYAKETATAALLHHYWAKDGRNRHALALAVAGFLGKQLPKESVLRIIRAAAAGDEEVKDRLRAAEDTIEKLVTGGPVTGAPTLDKLVPGLGKRLSDWWGFPAAPDTLISFNSFLSCPGVKEEPWPKDLAAEAFHGLAGQIVRALEPHTEADPAALLLNTLVAAGNVVGNHPYCIVGREKHYPRLFGVMVGKTSKARKGTSWADIRGIISYCEPEWVKNCIVSGLSSGEGLIWAVRDPIIKREPIKQKQKVIGYQDVETDPGVSDKRLLVIEPELARTLKVMSRDGNTLSATTREAWDTGYLRVLTKNSPAKATDAHVSIVGHITQEELLRDMESTETANGFANRFLWVMVKRSKVLPEGGYLPEEALKKFGDALQQVVSFAQSVGELRRDPEARELWAKVYPKLSEGLPGLVGAVTNRAEAQVIRLSCVYAVLDRSSVIKAEHLIAALAFWDRVEASVRYIFGDRIGDALADTILEAVRNSGRLSQTAISNLLGRNQSANKIGLALAALHKAGHIIPQKRETGGRPEIFWVPANTQATK
jgi:hypothetical protein